MAGGMIGSGQSMRTSALQSMQRYSSLDAKMKADIETNNKATQIAERQQNTQLGGAAGMAVGAVVAGPVGAVVGGLIGGVAGSLF